MTLQELQNLLKTRSVAYVNISDTLGNAIRNNVYFKDLSDYNNDISVLLQKLSNDHDKVVLTPRLRNGSSFKAYKKPFTVILKGTQKPVIAPPMTNSQPQAMNGNFGGLSAPQFYEAIAAQSQLSKLKQDYKELKDEFRAVKAQREKLRDEVNELRTNYKVQEVQQNQQPSAIDKILEGIAANPNALTAILGMVGNRGATAPLNATQPIEQSLGLEGAKAKLMQVIEEHPENYCQLYVSIINRLNTDENFAKLVNNELKKQIQNE